LDGINVGTPATFQSTDQDRLAFDIELPDLGYSQFSFQENEEPTATLSYLGTATLEHHLPLTSASTPTSTNTSTHLHYDADSISNAIAKETRRVLLLQAGPYRAPNPNDLISVLGPITVGL
jgi:hypothetical protein